MKKLCVLIVLAMSLASLCSCGESIVTEVPSFRDDSVTYKLVWSDEFNGSALDTDVWNYEEGFIRNKEIQYYTSRPENVRLENGCLVLQGQKEQYEGAEYTSGSVNTKDKKAFMHGRIEIRAKLPYGAGMWPAFWTMGANDNWPECGEIDMLEMWGGTTDGDSRITGALHYTNNFGNKQSMAVYDYKLPKGKFNDDFHIFGLELADDYITWYIDDTVIESIFVDMEDMSEFQQEQYILLNLAMGGACPPPNEETVFPQQYQIDWLRVYQAQ